MAAVAVDNEFADSEVLEPTTTASGNALPDALNLSAGAGNNVAVQGTPTDLPNSDEPDIVDPGPGGSDGQMEIYLPLISRTN